MEKPELPGNDLMLEFDFQNQFNGLSPETASLLDACRINTLSADMPLSWIGEIESLLMKDDEEDVAIEPSQEVVDHFFADLLVDSVMGGSSRVIHSSSDKDQTQSSQVTRQTQFGDQSHHCRPRMKRKCEEEETVTVALTSNGHDDGSGRGYEGYAFKDDPEL
ncbi:hypothetical protein NL676_009104 [Syzygium grande]|nr:hypothetical protein NL676_009104 [Syzygium grande]